MAAADLANAGLALVAADLAAHPGRASGRGSSTVGAMDVETAIRTRRTHKAYRPEPVAGETLAELLELARWAPNHNLTNPWRFRVVGPRALERLKAAAGPESAPKLDRAPTLVVCSCVLSGDPVQDEEDLHATAVAAYIVLLGAHARGLAGYWRTPEVLRTEQGRRAVELRDDERFVGLLHLGHPIQEQRPPERVPAAETAIFLD
jgi:nitroreductase